MATEAVALRSSLASRIAENERQIQELETEDELLELVSNLVRRLIDAEVTDGVQAVEKL